MSCSKVNKNATGENIKIMVKKTLKLTFYVFLILFQLSCKKEETANELEENVAKTDTISNKSKVVDSSMQEISEKAIIYDTIEEFILKADNSFLKLSQPEYWIPFFILNEDGTIWKKIALHDTYHDNEFEPYSLIPEYNRVKLRIVGKVNDMYKVIVNEEKMTYKFVKVSDKNFIFQDMDHFIIDTAFIEFDPETNLLYSKADTLSTKVKYDSEANYIPIEVKKEWMKLQNIENNKYGWIRWKNTSNEVIVNQLR